MVRIGLGFTSPMAIESDMVVKNLQRCFIGIRLKFSFE